MDGGVIRLLKTPEQAANSELISKLRNCLAQAESGEAIGITGVLYLRGGKYKCIGTSTYSRHEQAGALLDCAIERLKDDG